MILASEDIGNADPHGLLVAVAAVETAAFVGMPEARISLAQATTYLACAPKSNAAYMAIERPWVTCAKAGCCPCRAHLRSASYSKRKNASGTGYQYAHDFPALC